jgi:ATP-dependent DNA helicase RecG
MLGIAMHEAEQEIQTLIRGGESLAVEFKSDVKSLPDRDLVAAVVALANTEGGDLFLGVEDDGTPTGLHANHRNLAGLPALIANKTIPSLAVRVEALELEGQTIARIQVPKSRQLVSTSDGLLQRRRLRMDGTPEAVPFYPHEFVQRQSSLGVTDPSALPVENLAVEDLDPIQRIRIRNAIKKYGGDQSLTPLADDELDGALGLTVNVGGQRHPTVAGLLLLGSDMQLRQHLPSHEVAFQVLRGTDVLVNEFYRKPLLETFEEVEVLFRARVEEEEIQVGLFRVPIPNFDRRAFREAFVNALVHRDYSALGAVHVKLDDDGLSISNPGGFVEGVNLDNLLVADPRSRNPLLADIIKRIGLAERTGRGIDRIFEGMLRYGRTAPDYSMSSAHTVSVRMSAADADAEFLRMIDLAKSVQKPETAVRGTLEKLVEAGLVKAHGGGAGRTYTLSAKVYRGAGEKAAYVRQAGFDTIQQEQMVMSYIDLHGSIKRADVVELCHISPDQAYKLLSKLRKRGEIEKEGDLKGASYKRAR